MALLPDHPGNEQVEDGSLLALFHEVTQKELDQWFFRITDYAEELLEFTNKLPGCRNVCWLCRQWIGKSYGSEINFALEGRDDGIRSLHPSGYFVRPQLSCRWRRKTPMAASLPH